MSRDDGARMIAHRVRNNHFVVAPLLDEPLPALPVPWVGLGGAEVPRIAGPGSVVLPGAVPPIALPLSLDALLV
jgi:hypothetical protein